MAIEPVVARKTWRTLEPVHGMIYFAREAFERYEKLGLRDGYFASRAAALGPVSAEVVIATFFNFNPSFVRQTIPHAWEVAPPSAWLDARLDAVDAALRRAWGDDVASDDIVRAADLARRAAETACERVEGRPLFAAHAALAWPGEPHLVLWHAQTLLREMRGDAHIAALVAEGISAIEALVVHAATGDVAESALQSSRAWPEAAWAEGVQRLRSRGFLADGDDLALSRAGAAHRQWVEDRTDAASVYAYDVLGDDGCEELRTRVRPFSRRIVEGGLLSGFGGR